MAYLAVICFYFPQIWEKRYPKFPSADPTLAEGHFSKNQSNRGKRTRSGMLAMGMEPVKGKLLISKQIT